MKPLAAKLRFAAFARSLAVSVTILGAVACSAVAENPDPSKLRPAASTPRATQQPASSAQAAPNGNAASVEPATSPAAKTSTADATPEAATTSPSTSAPVATTPESATEPVAAQPSDSALAPRANDIVVALVDGRPIGVRDFLHRQWLRDSQGARDVLDQLVVSELALREAERLEIRVGDAKVEEKTEQALTSLEKKLAERGRKVTLEEHLRQTLGVDFATYRKGLRGEATVQLLAERAVRAYSMENERAVVRLVEIDGREAMDAFRAELAAGKDFAELAKVHGGSQTDKDGGVRLVIVKSESSTLARLAFSTPEGQVGGPLEEGGKFALVKVEKLLAPQVGAWSEIGAAVEASLLAEPVDDLEYAQWKTAIGRRYEVDLAPFLELVGASKP